MAQSWGEKEEAIVKKVTATLMLHGHFTAHSDAEKLVYLVGLARYVGLDPITRPFGIVVSSEKRGGKRQVVAKPYMRKEACDELARKHNLSREVIDGPRISKDGILVCTVRVFWPARRRSDMGFAARYAREDLAGELMKVETAAKRRATIAILGMGLPMTEDDAEAMRQAAADDDAFPKIEAPSPSPVEIPRQVMPPGLMLSTLASILQARSQEELAHIGDTIRDMKIPPDSADSIRLRAVWRERMAAVLSGVPEVPVTMPVAPPADEDEDSEILDAPPAETPAPEGTP